MPLGPAGRQHTPPWFSRQFANAPVTMMPPTLEIRPGLHIEIQAIPGAVRFQWRIAGTLAWLDDSDGGAWPAAGHDPQGIPGGPALADLALIETCLRQHAEACRRQHAAGKVTARFLTGG